MSTNDTKKIEPAVATAPASTSAAGGNKWVKLSNRARTKKELVATVTSNPESGWIFLKNARDEILCSVQHTDPADFEAELATIDEQMD
ncbi:hypothetical protein ACM64Y_18990 [Novispirillum sp. DQ9]|uniref:hypothetical protein n=1 Tax=Novispirillum sp. DQ9 TaxID=3398612 RepID=UPI003C7E7C99